MTKKLPLEVKLSRKPTSRACVFCHQKHLQCDPSRPCKNCVKRCLGDTCVDVKRKKSKAALSPSKFSVSKTKTAKEKVCKIKKENKEKITKPRKPRAKKNSVNKSSMSKILQDDIRTSLHVVEPVPRNLQDSAITPGKDGIPQPDQNISLSILPKNQSFTNNGALKTITSSNLSIFKGLLQNILNSNDAYPNFGPPNESHLAMHNNNDNILNNSKNAKFFVGTPPAETSAKNTVDKLDFSNNLETSNATIPEVLHNSMNFQQLPKLDKLNHDKCEEGTDEKNFEIINNFDTEINFFDTNSETNPSTNGSNDICGPNNNFHMQEKDDTEFSNFFYDGLNNQVILRPFIRLSENDHAMSVSDSQSINSNFGTPVPPEIVNNTHVNSKVNSSSVDKHPYFIYNQFGNINNSYNSSEHNVQSTKEFIDNFKRNNMYKSPLYIRKKVFQEVGDLYAKFPIFDLNRLYKNHSNNRNSSGLGIHSNQNINDDINGRQYDDLKHIIEILCFNSMKSYQELIKYFYDRLYLQCIDNFERYHDSDLEKRKIFRQKLFFKILEKIWIMHNHFRIQSALIQTDFNSLTNFSDNLLNELMFHRQLLNFENMINSLTSTPAIIWRKSTEIVFISDELCILIGIKNKSKFLSRRRFLCEIIDELSILNYFKLCNSIFKNKDPGAYHSHHSEENFDALENELSDERINNGSCVLNGGMIRFNCKFINHNYNPNKTVLKKTEILLNEASKKSIFPYEINEELELQQRFISCSCILTIKKDMFDIPMLIVGQFLPILE